MNFCGAALVAVLAWSPVAARAGAATANSVTGTAVPASVSRTAAATALSGTAATTAVSGTAETGQQVEEAKAEAAAEAVAKAGAPLEGPASETRTAASAGSAPGAKPLPHAKPPLPRSRWSDRGFEYRFSLGVLVLRNGQALSYMPLEGGYRFADGWRLRAGLELFYYTGLDTDNSTGPSPQPFYYQMEDIRFSALYEWRWNFPVRPLAGVTVESVLGSRWLAVNPAPPTPQAGESAHSFEAAGAEGGLEYRGGPNWSVSLEARYARGAGTWATLFGTDLGCHYLF